MKYKILLFLLSISWAVWAQENANLPTAYRFASYTSSVPEEVLYTKSVVFVDVVSQKGDRASNEWRELANTLHSTFREVGIDAVAYYAWQDVNAGKDVAQQLGKELSQREIKNVVFLTHNQPKQQHMLLIAPFDTENPFVNRKENAYQVSANNPQTLSRQLIDAVRRSGLERQNYLVIDQPEFFVGAGNIVRGKRAEGFAQDLKLDKLAIPRFETADDSVLAQVMEPYPYEYDLVDPQISEDELRQKGYQFILLNLHTQAANIRKMLGYQGQANVPLPNKPVYKYYVKHIYTGDVYLGDTWDADPNWRTALINHLRSMKQDMTMGSR